MALHEEGGDDGAYEEEPDDEELELGGWMVVCVSTEARGQRRLSLSSLALPPCRLHAAASSHSPTRRTTCWATRWRGVTRTDNARTPMRLGTRKEKTGEAAAAAVVCGCRVVRAPGFVEGSAGVREAKKHASPERRENAAKKCLRSSPLRLSLSSVITAEKVGRCRSLCDLSLSTTVCSPRPTRLHTPHVPARPPPTAPPRRPPTLRPGWRLSKTMKC